MRYSQRMSGRLRGASATLIALTTLSAATARAAPPREPAPVPYAAPTSRARVVNAHWVQVYLPENRYDPAVVTETARYALSSSDDAAFSTARQPAEVHHRTFPEEATYAEQRVAP